MRKLLLLLVVLLIPASLMAQDEGWRNRRSNYRGGYADNFFELTPFLGYRYGGTIFAESIEYRAAGSWKEASVCHSRFIHTKIRRGSSLGKI